jgi:hypothetical protein
MPDYRRLYADLRTNGGLNAALHDDSRMLKFYNE